MALCSVAGAKSMAYRMASKYDKAEAPESAEDPAKERALKRQKEGRRGIKTLGLKKEPKQKFWREARGQLNTYCLIKALFDDTPSMMQCRARFPV
jgi:hypothetical protein